MNKQVSPSFEDQIGRAVLTPEPRPEFARQLWQRMTALSTAGSTQAPAFHRILRRPGWALAGLVILALLIGTVIVGPQRVLAELQKGLAYIRGVGFVSTEQGLAIREPVQAALDGKTVTVEQLLSSDEEAVLTLRLQGFPPYQDIGLEYGVWLALPDGYAYRPREYSVGITARPGEYVGVFKFRPLPAGTDQAAVVWQPAPGEPELRIQVHLSPLTDAMVRERLPESYSPEGAIATIDGISLVVDQVSTGRSTTGIRLQTYFPADLDYAWVNAPVLSDESGRTYEAVPGVHFEDQGQPVEPAVLPGGGDVPAGHMFSTFEFPVLNAGVKRLMLTCDGVSFGASPRVEVSVNLGEQPAVGDVFAVNQSFDVGGMGFLIRQARLVPLPTDGVPRAGLILDIEPEDPTQVKLEQIWLYETMFVDGYLYDPESMTWTNGWLVEEIPSGAVEVKVRSLRGTILGEWQIQWDQPQP